MFQKILVAVDHEPGSKQVFNQALSLAKADGGNLILLHVVSVEEENSPFMSPYLVYHKNRCIHVDPRIMRQANEEFDREWANFKQQGMELLRTFTKKAIAAGVSTEFTQITGQPSSTICEFAQSCHADVITIGRRGRSGFQEMLLGSVSNYVVHHAPCSVLLVQTPILEESTLPNSAETTIYA
ncbi:universal stress protein [Waterburya agarophytonicola K14]|uniref:Universal stress protein n=1 Tax=Waterburya agarophytonicola KI4 TaxID=2874699 RepID=A0A964BSM2_9CYAN|nr:universal stress protein [Waterburya agarophytonicola]MCC0177773.1 universal stress protein [Waterburya agarophytonicola KI4]